MILNKYIVTILLSVGYFGLSMAQVQKGSVLMGGEISNLNWKLGGDQVFSGTISPEVAFFINDNMAVGAYLSFHSSVAKGINPSTTYGVGVLGRYYPGKGNNFLFRKSKFFLEGTTGIEGYNPSEGDNTNGIGFSAGPGFTYFISPAIGLEALAKYKGIVGFGAAATSHDVMFSFGFQVYLNRNNDIHNSR